MSLKVALNHLQAVRGVGKSRHVCGQVKGSYLVGLQFLLNPGRPFVMRSKSQIWLGSMDFCRQCPMGLGRGWC